MNFKSFGLTAILLSVTLICSAIKAEISSKYAGFEFEPIGPVSAGMLGVLEDEKIKILKSKCQDFKNVLEQTFYDGNDVDPYMCNTRFDYTPTSQGEIVEKYDHLYQLSSNQISIIDKKSPPDGMYATNRGNQYGCLIDYRVFVQDIDLDGLEEVFWFYGNVYESPKLYHTSEYMTRYEIDLYVYSGNSLRNIISNNFVEENYKPEKNEDSPLPYQASAFPGSGSTAPYNTRKASYRHLAKLYVADLDEDGLNDVIIWHRSYESRLKTDPVAGFKYSNEYFSHWEETKTGNFEKQPVSNSQGQKWLTDKGLSWKDGFPKESFCQNQTQLYPVILQRVITGYDDKLKQPIYDETLNLNDPILEQ